ncbi:MAG: peptidoglycan-binding protein [Geminicoccaceae bacterium]|nr:peptidoglycan-binding protein [Geminicoccaceae bacterium]MCS7266637.1 peptidoglycan-binding protein [Geminicoccaceae bacterium]MCX7629261.1 peptidoglycan-binding protein [Geminicoccaceae bacterium]MDW8123270.1 peptidoglycan-binding protein [Geminicoccaceae bacterium]MDW8340429.1 peptidoglycan-binding protein [Geminicoccaceae bacterium]
MNDPIRAGAAALALVLSASGPLFARDKDGSFAVKGLGNETCGALMQAFKEKKPGVEAWINWLEGYLTGLNDATPQTYDIASWQSPVVLFELTARYCSQNESHRLIQAAKAIEDLIRPFKLAQRSPVVEIKVGDRTLKHYQETIRRAQELLIKQGFLQGKADGSWGPKTQAAFEAYQERSGLRKTGLPDQETLFKLFFEARQAGLLEEPQRAAAPAASERPRPQAQPPREQRAASPPRQAPSPAQSPAAPAQPPLNLQLR